MPPRSGCAPDACRKRNGGRACQPNKTIANDVPLPAEVGAHSPQGDSPFGVKDLMGTVWQLTSEVVDLHSRSNMLRGGSSYQAGINGKQGSHWYFPMVETAAQHNHYRLMSDSYERAGTLGFRCVRDVAATAAAAPGAGASASARAAAAAGTRTGAGAGAGVGAGLAARWPLDPRYSSVDRRTGGR